MTGIPTTLQRASFRLKRPCLRQKKKEKKKGHNYSSSELSKFKYKPSQGHKGPHNVDPNPGHITNIDDNVTSTSQDNLSCPYGISFGGICPQTLRDPELNKLRLVSSTPKTSDPYRSIGHEGHMKISPPFNQGSNVGVVASPSKGPIRPVISPTLGRAK